jgi:hypothetical protein
VGHGDHGARILLEEALEPRHRLGVEMVGGLVEQQQIGTLEQADRHSATRRRSPPESILDRGLGRAGSAARPSRSRAGGRGPTGCPWSILSCTLACSSSSLASRRRPSGSANFALIVVPAVHHRHLVGRRPPARSRARLRRIELRLLRQEADRVALAEERLADVIGSSPAMMRSSELLPAPFAPSTPILAPSKNESQMPFRISRLGGHHLAEVLHGEDEIGRHRVLEWGRVRGKDRNDREGVGGNAQKRSAPVAEAAALRFGERIGRRGWGCPRTAARSVQVRGRGADRLPALGEPGRLPAKSSNHRQQRKSPARAPGARRITKGQPMPH